MNILKGRYEYIKACDKKFNVYIIIYAFSYANVRD